ncbi:MAG: adenylate kinase [Erysipelotrichaceae bacterium]|nr:adenylate kinase [Erysipelotrichaceae bacterium]MDY5252896.1 adenylate kinase [Erysipelotrichaceae bacterium]
MQKVIVIGCPGAGKSYFAKQLHALTGLPLYHLDMIWHKSDKTNITKQEFKEQLDMIIEQEGWIIDGNYQDSLAARLVACDTVFFLDYPLAVCLEGAKTRIGKKRDDMPWIEEVFDEEFKAFIEAFPSCQLPYIYQLLEQHADKEIIIFKDRQQAQTYLDALKNVHFHSK